MTALSIFATGFDAIIAAIIAAGATRELFAAWRQWCTDAGEQSGTEREFGPALEARGYLPRRTNIGKRYAGIGLITADDEEE